MFKQKFRQIEEAMNRSKNGVFIANGTEPSKSLTITKDAKRIIRKFQGYFWPKNFQEKLPEAIQRSLNNWKAIQDSLRKYAKTHSRDRALIDHILECHGMNLLIYNWFESAFQRVSEWDEWSGNVNSILFHSKSKLFRQMFIDWVVGYTLNHKRAYVLLEVLKDAD
jgi:hypothetical protein